MSFAYDIRNFQVTTGAPGTGFTQAYSLNGLTPKVIIACMSGAIGAVGGLVTGTTLAWSRGWAVSTTSMLSVGVQSRVTNPTANANAMRDDRILTEVNADTLKGGLAPTDMSTADQVTYGIVGAAFSQNYQCWTLVLAGTDITNAVIFNALTAASAGSQNITDPGFLVKWFEVLCTGNTGTVPYLSTAAACVTSVGWGLPATPKNFVMGNSWRDAQATSITGSYCNDVECLALPLSTNPASIPTRVAVTGTNANGWTWNNIEMGSALRFGALALAGTFQVDMDVLTTQFPADPGYAAIQPAFDPLAVLFGSCCRAESTTDVGTTTAELSLGASTAPQSTGKDAAATFHDLSANATGGVPKCAITDDDCYVNLAAAGTNEGSFGHAAAGDQAALIKYGESTTDATPNFVGYTVFGAAPAAPSTAMRDMIDRHQQIPVPR